VEQCLYQNESESGARVSVVGLSTKKARFGKSLNRKRERRRENGKGKLSNACVVSFFLLTEKGNDVARGAAVIAKTNPT
jgi:hypothetical protein